MFSIGRRCPALRSGPRLYRSPTSTRHARFSQTARNGGDNSNSSHEGRKPTGSYTRVLAIFALGVPIGWGVHTLNDTRSGPSNSAKPTDFVKYALAAKEDISSTCSIFTLKPAQGSAIDTAQLYDQPAITSVQFKQPQLQIARSYTVLPPHEGQAPDELRFLIRKEQNGEVSGYLHRLALGSTVELRGPSVDYLLPESVTDVVFLAGGTGIAPALQVGEKLGKAGMMHILWANRRREDCLGGMSDSKAPSASSSWSLFSWWSSPTTHAAVADTVTNANQSHAIVGQVESIKRRHTSGLDSKTALLVDYYVDEEGTFIRPTDVTKLLDTAVQDPGKRLILVSGPEGFVNYWTGPKQWVGGREVQGPLGGALATFDLHGWQVVKL
ncbi:hypothetical protein B0A55_11968 [Friedmanniomyces simplex]|uniref:FAD-binding FR-type domain-containing protein n=1 Tax=Friedmanniomyces simplex TaxID=329884 RepID=A0A4U0WJC4_9PEZI|nr:hypothetical protein B0A55_11968 [Friedmanniomyces simplex]